jgi:hypothetical protein
MSGLEPRSGGRLTRRERERRAYRLTLATGAAGLAAVAGIVLALLDVIGAGLPLLLIVLAVVFGLMLRRTLGR